MKKVVNLILMLALSAGASLNAFSATISFDFEDLPDGLNTSNYASQGFVFSPRCHYHATTGYQGTPSPTGKSLTFDNSGCYDGSASGYNHSYLGASGPLGPGMTYPGQMYVARLDGQSFSLKSFIFTSQTDGGGYDLTSSKGGSIYAEYSTDLYDTLAFSGPSWTDVDWILFQTRAGDDPVGFDNLIVEANAVPEPGTLALLTLAPFAFASRRRAAGIRKPKP